MADVQIQQTPNDSGSGGGAGLVWALLVIVLLAVIAWFVFGGGLHKSSTTKIDINANTPGASSGGGAAPSGGGAAPSGGAPKTP